jgi:4-nitrophenyl phosphatase
MRRGASHRLRSAEGVLVDLDGTLIVGGGPAPGALQLITEWRDRVVVVSNYSTMTSVAMSAQLAGMGLVLPPERICLAGEWAIARLAAERPGARVLCLLTSPMKALAEAHGLLVVEDDAEMVLLGRDLDLTYHRIERAARALYFGASLIVTNLDPSHPGPGLVPVPETGSILAALLACSPGTIPRVVGKPQPELFHQALGILGNEPARAVMIGDSPESDIAGAQAAGIPSILVGGAPGAQAPHIAALLDPQRYHSEILR